MPSILSKVWQKASDLVLQPDWVFTYNCYEIGHTWAFTCSDAAVDMGLICLREGLKMYSGLYILSHLVFQRKQDTLLQSTSKIIVSTLRSSAFLGFNAWAVFTCFCGLRGMSGKYVSRGPLS